MKKSKEKRFAVVYGASLDIISPVYRTFQHALGCAKEHADFHSRHDIDAGEVKVVEIVTLETVKWEGARSMSFIVYTPTGEYHVNAPSAADAKEAVWKLTSGRIEVVDMTARRERADKILNAGQHPGVVSCASDVPAGGARNSASTISKGGRPCSR